MDGKSTEATVVYEDFEPYCKWQRNEDRDILEIHLQEFKKEELRVQISNHGILKITGERRLDESKASRFYKEVPVSRGDYDTSSIQAKFVNGRLSITLPKRKHVPEASGVPPPPTEAPKIEQTLKSEPAAPKLEGQAPPPPPVRQASKAIDEGGFACKGRGRNRTVKVAVTLAATAAALAVLVAYVVYMYKATVGEADD